MLNWIVHFLANRWSCQKGSTRLNILTYHRVNEIYDARDPKTIELRLFRRQLKWLKKHFVVLSLPEALQLQSENKLPAKAVCITVDDGYRDSYDVIYPSLLEEGLTATFFISTKGLEEGGLWDAEIYFSIFNAPSNVKSVVCAGKSFDLSTFEHKVESRYLLTGQVKYLPQLEREAIICELKKQTICREMDNHFLTEQQIKIMHSTGMTIAAHTHNHPILMKENDDIAFFEIIQNKLMLEEIIKAPVNLFAYPNGKYNIDYNDKHIAMVKEIGFEAAFSTDWGCVSTLASERYQLKRFTPWDANEFSFVLRLALNYRSG